MYVHSPEEGGYGVSTNVNSAGRLGAPEVDKGSTAWLTYLLGFNRRGFAVKQEFLKQYLKLAMAGKAGTTEDFRKAFCQANHAQFDWKPKSNPAAKPIRFYAAMVWGYAMIYSHFPGQKPLLHGIQDKEWPLQFAGGSIRTPQYALCK
jgi:hypothetical protein